MRTSLPGLAVLMLMLATPNVALAHAGLVRSLPASGAHLAVQPHTVQLWFSEGVEPTVTSLTVTGPGNAPVALGVVRAILGDSRSVVADFAVTLAPGQYTVRWRTIAKDDGHPSRGTFGFVVDTASGASVGATLQRETGPTRGAAVGNTLKATAAVSSESALDVEAPSYVMARWVSYVALIVMIGVVAFRALVLPRVGVGVRVEASNSFTDRVLARSASLGLFAGFVFVAAGIGRLFAERAVMGAGTGTVTILRSSWGRVWLVQVAIAIVGCIAFAASRKLRTAGARDAAWVVAGVVALALGTAAALSGHAAAAPEHRTLSLALDIVHVLSGGGWLGSLLVLVLVGVPSAVGQGSQEGGVLAGGAATVAELVSAFSPTALAFAALLVVSGTITAWLRIGSFDALVHSTYGAVLLVKLVFVALVFASGAFNLLRVRTALLQQDQTVFATRRLRQSGRFELIAGLLVIGATAVLVALQPPVQ